MSISSHNIVRGSHAQAGAVLGIRSAFMYLNDEEDHDSKDIGIEETKRTSAVILLFRKQTYKMQNCVLQTSNTSVVPGRACMKTSIYIKY